MRINGPGSALAGIEPEPAPPDRALHAIPWRQDPAVWLITGATLLLHLAVAGRYDIFRNELYFIVCGRHPDFGYADQPPLVPLLTAATQFFGDSPWLLRLPAAAAAAALVPLSAAFARVLGGGTRAATGAAAATALAPALAALTTILTTSTFEPLAWTAAAWLLARAVLRNDRRALVWAGVVAGLSMQAKYGIALWLIGLLAGLLLTPARRVLAWRQSWIGAGLAVAIAAPSLVWQTAYGWPFLAVILHHGVAGTNFTGTPLNFELGQIGALNAALAPLWLAGAAAPFLLRRMRPARFLVIAFIVTTALDIALRGKDYYLFPVYPTMFAAGAVACAGIPRWLAGAWLAAAAAVFVAFAPIVLPLLDPPALERYLAWTHLRPPPDELAAVGAPLTQVFSDELGWRALERDVAAIYRALPAGERSRAAIVAINYGEAAAIDVYGRADGLPPALSGQNQYFMWGPRGFDGSVIIHINGDPERWRRACASLEIAGTYGVRYAMPYENGRPIFICRGLRVSLMRAWPRFKRFQ